MKFLKIWLQIMAAFAVAGIGIYVYLWFVLHGNPLVATIVFLVVLSAWFAYITDTLV